MKRHTIKTDYLGSIYKVEEYTVLVKKFAAELKKFRRKNFFDAIAFTGTSGAAIAYPLSAMLGIPLICIRKDKLCHYRFPVEGCVSAERYVIVDDFISGGNTMKKITEEIKIHMPNAKPVAIFLYGMSGYNKTWNSYGPGANDIPIHYPVRSL